MSYLLVEDFRSGLDTRKSAYTTPPGALRRCDNAHITRGGEIEKRKAFALHADLTGIPGTQGLVPAGRNLYIFGSSADINAPSGLVYQRLVHPYNTTIELIAVLSADAFSGKPYVVAEFADRRVFHYYDGKRVTAWDTIADNKSVADGAMRQFVKRLRAFYSDTASNVAADSEGSTLRVYTEPAGQDSGLSFYIDTGADTQPEYTIEQYDGEYSFDFPGAIGYIPPARVTRITLSGAVGEDDMFTLDGLPLDAGGSHAITVNAGVDETARFVRTFGDKVYALVGSLLYFSGYSGTPPQPDPTVWPSADDTAGAGFINMSTQASGATDLTSLAAYQNYLAIFSANTIQIWDMDADPARNEQVQILPNIGTRAPESVLSYGEQDVFFLGLSGIRSLRARNIGNLAGADDVGTPIDDVVLDLLSTLSEAERAAAVSAIDPLSGRYWLAIGETIYVFSHFTGSGIAAWSTYTLGTSVDTFAVLDDRVYARAGDWVYAYGGSSGRVYDNSRVTVVLPFLDAGAPATHKQLHGLDAGCEGVWNVRLALDPPRPQVTEGLGVLEGTTFGQQTSFPVDGLSTHFSLTLTHDRDGPARLANLAVHYHSADDS